MTAVLESISKHVTTGRAPGGPARVVLSHLPRGESPVGATAISLKLVIEGEERYEIGGAAHVVRPGEFMILDQGARGRVVIPRPSRGMCVYLAPEALTFGNDAQGDVSPQIAGPSVLPTRVSQHARQLEALAGRLSANAALDNPQRIVDLAAAALNGLVREASRAERVDAIKPSTRHEICRRLEKVRDHLHACSETPAPLAELAAIAGMSRFHLARHFREVYGLPPAAYHCRIRLEAAARWLDEGHGLLAEAAERYGYSDASAFARAFKRQFGAGPASRRRVA